MNKSKLLGYVLVGYAFVTAGGLLGFVFAPLALGNILGALAWLLVSTGGIGLILGRHWGRVVALAASVVMMIAAIAAVVDETSTDDPLLFVIAFAAVASLAPLALFVAALLVGIPPPPESATQPQQLPWLRRRATRDIAYAAFVFLGVAALDVARLFFSLSQDSEDSLYAGLVFGLIGYGVPLLIAVALGPCLSVFLWRDSRLLLLLTATLAASGLLASLSLHSWKWILLPYGALSVGAGFLWFLRERRSFGDSRS